MAPGRVLECRKTLLAADLSHASGVRRLAGAAARRRSPTRCCAERRLANLRTERLNLDGAAAFAAFVPDAHRPAVVRAQVALQAAYDYVDTLAEQPCRDPIRNGDQLHKVLGAALDPTGPRIDYYAHHPQKDDAGYLQCIVDTCRAALRELPSYASVAAPMRRAARRMVSYQSLNLNEAQGDHAALARWANAQTPASTDLRWWETAASAGSSLGVYMLIAMAARACCPRGGGNRDRGGILPLDRLAPSAARQPGRSTRGPFERSTQPARLLLLTGGGGRSSGPDCGRVDAHGFKRFPTAASTRCCWPAWRVTICRCRAVQAEARLAARSVLASIGGLAAPTMLVMGARRALWRLMIAWIRGAETMNQKQ